VIDKMIFLGSGSAFTLDNFQSNVLLVDSERNQRLLIDAGSDVRHSLKQQNHSYKDINAIYISHLHGDHIGGMECIGFCTLFDPSCHRPHLFVSKALQGRLWSALAPAMESLQGDIAELTTYFDTPYKHGISKNGNFTWQNTKFQLVQTVHIVNGFAFEHSYGLLFKINNLTTFYTSDTQFAPNQLKDFYNMADIIFQDCETSKFKSGVHAHYTELITLPIETRNKIWLYHYQDGIKSDAKADGFRGFVKQGQVFDFNDIKSFE
jgi:hypothetical protein